MFSFKKSLILKISAVVFLVEFLVLTSLGLFYTELFSHQIDEYLESSIRLPGELMNRRVLRYETVADTDAMADILGDEFLEGLIVGEDGHIYFASDPDHVDKSIDDIPNVDSSLFANNSQKLIRTTEAGRPVIISITPLSAFEGAEPFFHVYIKAGVNNARNAKLRITLLFILGSAFCIILTSLAIIGYSRRHVTAPLSKLTKNADALQKGKLDVEISIDRQDEIGRLADSFSNMRDSIARQIAELENANESISRNEQQLNALIQAMPDLLLVLDKDGRYQEIYTSQTNLLAADTAALKGSLLHENLPEDVANSFLTAIQTTLETRTVQSIEYELTIPIGTRWFEARLAPINYTDGRQDCIWLVRDMTEHKDLETRLLQSKEELESANLRLTELDQIKSALVSSVSHELRTPLTSLLGFSKLILKNFSKHYWPLAKDNHKLLTKGSQIVENLNILIHEGDRLTRLINDVLDLNKIEMGYTEWRKEKITPNELAKRALDAVSGQFGNNPALSLVSDVADDLPSLVIDGDKMLQVLLNLLTNAAKFTSEGVVTLKIYSPFTEVVRFEIADTGPGIAPEEQERIFERFHQIGHNDPAGDKPHGAGLGLAICREIVAHHNGSIWVESVLGHGATFIIELPVK